MKQGFYFFEILGSYTITYIIESNDSSNEYKTIGVATISNDVRLENGEKNYIMKTSKSLRQYKYISNRSYSEWRKVVVEFMFTYYENN